ncbi:hypothetical protein CEW46_21425 [Bacillus cereus]|nr:hypothetical protein CEW46_21425 [Bacillus cereus]
MALESTLNIYVMEGYECTTKSSTIKKYFDGRDDMTYRPDYEGLNLDNYIPRNSRSLLGFEVLKFLKTNPVFFDYNRLAIDRGLISGLVYYEMYPLNGNSIEPIAAKLFELYKELHVKIVYHYHDDIEVAKKIFNNSLSREDGGDIYDDTEFAHYWIKYQTADKHFRAIMEKYELDVIPVPTSKVVANEDLSYLFN